MNTRYVLLIGAACVCAVLAACGAATPNTAVSSTAGTEQTSSTVAPAATGTSGTEATPGQPFQLAPGQSAEIAGMRVQFVRVTEDSRCPQGVQCITAGQASVEVQATHASGTDNATLTLLGGGSALPQSSATMGGHSLRFTALAPNRDQSQTPADQYRATFVLDAPAP